MPVVLACPQVMSFWLNWPIYLQILVSYSALFTILVGWHASGVSLLPGDVILAQLVCLPQGRHFLFIFGTTNLLACTLYQ
jgi:hypothetical protein